MKSFSKAMRLIPPSLFTPGAGPQTLANTVHCRRSKLAFNASSLSRSISTSRNHKLDLDKMSEPAIPDTPAFSEEELSQLLGDLFATPTQGPDPTERLAEELRTRIGHTTNTNLDSLQGLKERLMIPNHAAQKDNTDNLVPEGSPQPSVPTLSERLMKMSHLVPSPLLPKPIDELASPEAYLSILNRLETAVLAAEQSLPSTSKAGVPQLPLALGIASDEEWNGIVRKCMRAGDFGSAQKAADLAKRSGCRSVQSLHDLILLGYVSVGDTHGLKQFIKSQRALGILPSELQRHLHVQVYIEARQLAQAQQIIHSYEESNLVPAEATYIAFIRSLLSVSPSLSANRHRALAWDMFAHMRYVAHPKPSAELYAVMIRACADATVPSAERALDLFTEMTVDNQIPPTRDAYNATILTCARSSSRKFAHEAFRLGKELVNLYQSTTNPDVRETLRPNADTFNALLESAKRTGDLARARWILAELLRAGEEVDDQIMANVFQVYASYKPPFQRGSVNLGEAADHLASTIENKTSSKAVSDPPSGEMDFFSTIPQTHGEVLREAQALFQRVSSSAQSRRSQTPHDTAHFDPPFANITVSTHLLNSYLSVLYNHSALDLSLSMYNSLFSEYRCRKNSQTFADVLGRLANTRNPEERRKSRPFAEPIWKEWLMRCDTSEYSSLTSNFPIHGSKISPRRIESVWASMIRIITLSEDLEGASALIKQFTTRYPPHALLPPPLKTGQTMTPVPATSPSVPSIPVVSDKITLEGRRPLVRLTVNHEIRDDVVPPFFTFKDVELLHHRLTARADNGKREKEQLRYLTYICRAYGGTLKKRKEWVSSGKHLLSNNRVASQE